MSPNEQQAGFAAAILDPALRIPGGLRPSSRFAIYRNNVFAGLLGTLRSRFPVTERLLGTDCFDGCGLRFIATHPPSSPVIHEYGAAFADILGTLPELTSLAYLADVARLEWARHAALHAADAPVLQPQDLAGVPADRVGDLTFRLHPAAQLVRSAYPIHAIWQTNTRDAETHVISADLAGESVLVARQGDDVSVLPLPPAAAAFVAALFAGEPLSVAAGMAPLDIAPVLAALLQAQAFTDYKFFSHTTQDASCLSTA